MVDYKDISYCLCSSLDDWQKMVGDDEDKELQVTHSRDSGLDVSSPKHGKVHDDGQALYFEAILSVFNRCF